MIKELSEILHILWLRSSIKKSGIITPILISSDNYVLNGSHRVIIARKLGITSISAIRLAAKREEISPDSVITYFDKPDNP